MNKHKNDSNEIEEVITIRCGEVLVLKYDKRHPPKFMRYKEK